MTAPDDHEQRIRQLQARVQSDLADGVDDDAVLDEGETPTLFLELPVCLACGSSRLLSYGSPKDKEGGSWTRYTNCGECGKKHRVVVETRVRFLSRKWKADEDDPIQPASRLTTVGRLAAELQLTVSDVRKLGRSIGALPCDYVNEVPIYLERDADRIRDAARKASNP